MANPRLLDKRRKSIRNIRKITRTMELIATARFKKAMDRASAATAFTSRMTQARRRICSRAACEVQSSAARRTRDTVRNVTLLVLTANRGLCGGFNGNLQRAGFHRWLELKQTIPNCQLEIVGKRGIAAFKFRGITPDTTYTHFEDKPTFDEVDVIASRYLDEYITGKLDRLDVVYTKFESMSRQHVVIETLLPLGAIGGEASPHERTADDEAGGRTRDLRIPAVAGKHFGRSRARQLQNQIVQVFPGLRRQRANRPHGRDEIRHRKRRRPDPPT